LNINIDYNVPSDEVVMTERAGKVTTTKNRFNISLQTPCIIRMTNTVRERGRRGERGRREG
jgi:hypothetical protein